jgi:hypothetical protein
VSPTSGKNYGSPVPFEFHSTCSGGVPFTVFIDGVGYGQRGKTLVPRPNYNPGCDNCSPQLGGEDIRLNVRLEAGEHRIEVAPGYQGTDLPEWDSFSATFSVGSGSLPSTGSNVPGWPLGIWLIAAGLVVSVVSYARIESLADVSSVSPDI